MSFVAINVLSVPEGARATLEERFGARKGAVDTAPGFEHFELLRPMEGTSDYLVYTRWRSEADFRAWRESERFGQGHGHGGGPTGQDGPSSAGPSAGQDAPADRPAAAGSTLWTFEVAQHSSGAATA